MILRNVAANGQAAAAEVCPILDLRTSHRGASHRAEASGRNPPAEVGNQSDTWRP